MRVGVGGGGGRRCHEILAQKKCPFSTSEQSGSTIKKLARLEPSLGSRGFESKVDGDAGYY